MLEFQALMRCEDPGALERITRTVLSSRGVADPTPALLFANFRRWCDHDTDSSYSSYEAIDALCAPLPWYQAQKEGGWLPQPQPREASVAAGARTTPMGWRDVRDAFDVSSGNDKYLEILARRYGGASWSSARGLPPLLRGMNPPGNTVARFSMSDWSVDGTHLVKNGHFIGDLLTFAVYRAITKGAALALEALDAEAAKGGGEADGETAGAKEALAAVDVESLASEQGNRKLEGEEVSGRRPLGTSSGSGSGSSSGPRHAVEPLGVLPAPLHPEASSVAGACFEFSTIAPDAGLQDFDGYMPWPPVRAASGFEFKERAEGGRTRYKPGWETSPTA